MSEFNFVIKNQNVEYEGLFCVNDLYQVINKFLKDLGYDWKEPKHHEYVGDTSKYVELHLEPWKKVSDYVKLVLRINIKIYNMKDVIIEKEGKKINMQKGKVVVRLDAILVTDYEGKWEEPPIKFFLRALFDKFIYKRYTDNFANQLRQHAQMLISNIKSYLNLYNYKFK